ncbi:MAG TPA: ABC transporter permease, partial [bacterium]|nr:ABC transporter permease [bacterium]
MTRFVLRMLWRDSRASWPRLTLFLLCIAAGVGGLVAVQGFRSSLDRAIQADARTLMAADLVVRNGRPLGPLELAAVAPLERAGARVARSAEFLTMARSPTNGQVLLVDARSVSAGYPLYGQVLLREDAPLRALLRDDTVVVQTGLLVHLGLHVGDSLQLGGKTFHIAGELLKEPDSPVALASVGPRVLMTERGGEETGLISASSRVRYGLMLRLPPGMDVQAAARALRGRLAGS